MDILVEQAKKDYLAGGRKPHQVVLDGVGPNPISIAFWSPGEDPPSLPRAAISLGGPTLTAPVAAPAPTLDLATVFEDSQLDLNEKRRGQYGQEWRRYLAWLDGRWPTLERSREYLAWLRDHKGDRPRGLRGRPPKAGRMPPNTLKFKRDVLRVWHRSQGEHLDFRIPRRSRLPAYFAWEELARLPEKARGESLDYAVLLLLHRLGLRKSEPQTLRWSNIDLERKTARIIGKGDKEREVPLSSALLEALGRLPRNGDLVFPALTQGRIYKLVKDYGKLAGRPELYPHAFRSSLTTYLLEKGVPQKVVQELVGHEEASTTQKYYCSISPSARAELRNILEGPGTNLNT